MREIRNWNPKPVLAALYTGSSVIVKFKRLLLLWRLSVDKPSSDDNGEKNKKKKSLYIASSDDSSQSEPENETSETERKLQNDFSAHSTNERVKLIPFEKDDRKLSVEKRKESVSGSEIR